MVGNVFLMCCSSQAGLRAAEAGQVLTATGANTSGRYGIWASPGSIFLL